MGSGASKIGKKVAQSEAGKSAGRAAIKGASDAAAQDLSNRYFGEETTTPNVPITKQQVTTSSGKRTTTTSTTTVHHTQPSKRQTDSDEEFEQYEMHKNTFKGPQKASKFSRFKPVINLKGSEKTSTPAKQAPVRRTQKEKIYKYVLSKEADWERQPRALTLYNYKAELRCDLEFRKGQVIDVLTHTDSQNDWWEGRLEGRVGIFPANYIKLL